jgi:hypothetical protein
VANVTKATAEKRRVFLAALADGHTVKHAAGLIGVSRVHMHRLRREDDDFAAEWADAVEEGVEALEQEARRRAYEGTSKPIVQGGRVVTDADGKPIELREYSDTLLIFLLKGKKPDTYRENQTVEHKGKVAHSHAGRIDLKLATDEELDVFERVAQRAAAATNGHAR